MSVLNLKNEDEFEQIEVFSKVGVSESLPINCGVETARTLCGVEHKQYATRYCSTQHEAGLESCRERGREDRRVPYIVFKPALGFERRNRERRFTFEEVSRQQSSCTENGEVSNSVSSYLTLTKLHILTC